MRDVSEVPQVLDICVRTITKVMDFGLTRHAPGSWRTAGAEDHERHLYQHVKDYMSDGNIEDLEHALCRIAMALWCIEHNSHEPDSEDIFLPTPLEDTDNA